VFYSDGLTEAANREGKFFGTGRLIDILAASTKLNSNEIADRMLEEVEKFTQGGAITDDRTLVVMKVK
jgi:sigma-B regulation protein RsbU (phosphoserine phosphatase)